MKKTVSILLTICSLYMLCSVPGFAADTAANDSTLSITLQMGNPMMTVNGTEEEIDPGRGIAPVIVNEHTLMPVRAIVEKMGGSVTWDADMQTVGLTYNGSEIQLTINSTTAYLNGAAQTLETAPIIINDRTMLPIRFIAESFDFNVSWDDANQLVTITNTPQDEIDSVLEASIVTSRDDLTFPVGDAVSGAFTGTAYLTPMINNDEIYHFPQTNNVTFEPGARSYWHSHGGMIMIGTGGVGYYQEEGQPVQIIRKGDVVECPEGVKHWHSAAPNSWFSQLVIYDSHYAPEGEVPESEPVTDEQYNNLEFADYTPQVSADNGFMFEKAAEALVSDTFNGPAYVSSIIGEDNVAGAPGLHYVVFDPGVINNWHTHEGGQILIATDGIGYHQIEGQPVEVLYPGDVAYCPPGEKHWHGGSADTSFAHIAVNTNPELTGLEWFDRISDEEYDSLAELITE